MLFDLRPKSSRRDLFNRELELKFLDDAAGRGDPLILVLGIRRIGKTSILRSFLENWNGIYIDMRGVVRTADLYERLSEGLSDSLGRLKRFLKNIRGIRILDVEVEVKWRGRDSISFLGLLEELNRRRERIIMILDEVQGLRPPISMEVKSLIAYAYDNLENVTVILSGSEIGLLRNFVGIDNSASPLYGRYHLDLMVKRFPKDLSMEFLRQGFKELNMSVDEGIIENAVNLFDGIVGWLVFFGRSYVDGVRDLKQISNVAVQMALNELNKLDWKGRMVLKAIAEGENSWSTIRRYVEEKRGITIPKSSLTRTIRKLEKLSIIENYRFLDPVYREASKRLR
ncbi:MAG TPA: ATP-binding protein [Candidatus Bathyarchaeota archaeon]|nr:MAG: ATP-binding protein [Candidatus Verstraetearchaeota archaeon]HDO20871.1 ATP-binding protein [Candidatus Bathyarchaeota archaeon]